MNWQQIREIYPGSWVVVEAVNAHTEGLQRVLDQLEVVAAFSDDSRAAWAHYEHIRQADRTRELYVLHTDRKDLDIGILDTFGRSVVEK